MLVNPACKQIRSDILHAAHASGHGHVPSCFSIVEILYAIYSVMQHRPDQPDWPDRDLFILSKGHGSLALYCVLAHFGYFPREAVHKFGAYGSDFGCHAHRLKLRGIEASTGSLGHGIGLATGMAMALKLRGSSRRVFSVVGDGEANEGSVWEAVLLARHLDLDNLTVVYDNNRSQNRAVQIQEPGRIFAGFGWQVAEVAGHDVKALSDALQQPQSTARAIIANTRKGAGSRTLMDYHAWHRRSPSPEELEMLMGELDAATV